MSSPASSKGPLAHGLAVHGLRIAVHEWSPRSASPRRAPVVALGSTGLSGLQWRRLAEALAERGHRVLAPDLVGYGQSDDWRGPGPFRVDIDRDVVISVLDHVGEPVHLVGHSYGGRTGLVAAMQRPDRVRSIAVFEPTCFGVLRSRGHAEGQAELDALRADGRFFADDFGGTEAWLERFIDYWGGPGTWAHLDDAARRSWLRCGRKAFEEVRETSLDTLPHSAYVEALGHVPLLSMCGATSTVAGRATSRLLAEVWPHPATRHVEVPGVGHMAPVLAAQQVARPIVDFIEAHDVTARGG